MHDIHFWTCLNFYVCLDLILSIAIFPKLDVSIVSFNHSFQHLVTLLCIIAILLSNDFNSLLIVLLLCFFRLWVKYIQLFVLKKFE